MAVNIQDKLLSVRWALVQACLGVTRKQLGADKFGHVVKTGSGSALASVTLWNTVRAPTQDLCVLSGWIAGETACALLQYPPWCRVRV